MPWWSWLVIWVCLGLALVAVLTVSAVRLFRKVVRVFADLAALANKTESLHGAFEAPNLIEPRIAILRDIANVQQERRREKAAATLRRESRHNLRIARAKALVRFDASSRSWFGDESANH